MAEDKSPSKRLKVQKGTDEINQDGVSYKPSQGGPLEDWHVDVPPEVADHMLRQGGAVEIIVLESEAPSKPDTSNLVAVRHAHDPKASLGWHGVSYEPDADGKLYVPSESVPDLVPHGFAPVS